MNNQHKLYISKALINQDILASEITSDMIYKIMNEIPFNQLEKSLLSIVIEHEPDLIEDYKMFLIEKLNERNE